MNKIAKLLSGVLAVVIGAWSAPAALTSQMNPDQENLVVISAGWSAVYLAPIGQEFVPDRRSLDAVELLLANSDTTSPFAADTEVNIREGSILGPVLGSSLPVSLPFGSWGVVQFDFPSSVHLVPGRTYVIDLVVSPGGGNVGVSGGWINSYPKGRVIIHGEPCPPTDNSDLWFREGTHRRGRRPGQ